MRHHWNLPEIFLGLSLVLIAVEALLARFSLVRARYRLGDSFASLSMYAGNIVMNLAMAGVVFAGLTVFYKVRLFTLSPTSVWAWVAIFFLDDFCYYWFHRISHECRFWWAACRRGSSTCSTHLPTIASIDRLFGTFVAVRGARDAFYVLFGPPDWRADGRGRTSKAIRAELARTLVAR